jgi:hypothetical protein
MEGKASTAVKARAMMRSLEAGGNESMRKCPFK